MKLTLLGTGHGIPSAERRCSSAMLEVNGTIYIIDAGTSVFRELLKRDKDIQQVKAVFTTHSHGDHTAGLFEMVSLIDCFYKTFYKDVFMDLYLSDERMVKLMEDYIQITALKEPDLSRTRMNIVKDGLVYRDENISVTYISNKHLLRKTCEYPSYSILIEAEGKKILFSGDLSGNIKYDDFPKVALEENIDVMLLEMAHFEYEHVEPYLKRCKVKQLWVNHIYPLTKIETLQARQAEYPFPIYIASDGDEIELLGRNPKGGSVNKER